MTFPGSLTTLKAVPRPPILPAIAQMYHDSILGSRVLLDGMEATTPTVLLRMSPNLSAVMITGISVSGSWNFYPSR
jgi:hypothetical protein